MIWIIKLGTSTVTLPEGGLHRERLCHYAQVIAGLMQRHCRVVLVSSGAVGAGRMPLGWQGKVLTVAQKQAAAAVGQGRLMEVYRQAFAQEGREVAQILLTRHDLADRSRYNHARETLEILLRQGVVPIVNENDTVATEELRFGDNDQLSSLVAVLLGADQLCLMTDTEGLYSADPRVTPQAHLISRVDKVTPEIESLAGGSRSLLSRGGMASKVSAAKVATEAGIQVTVAHGGHPERLLQMLDGHAVGTTFMPQPKRREGRKSWIAFGIPLSGRVAVDDGAVRALVEQGKSLLPAGVLAVEGEFEAGDLVAVTGPEGHEIARGLVAYSAGELLSIKGLQLAAIPPIMGGEEAVEVIHRDDLVLMERG